MTTPNSALPVQGEATHPPKALKVKDAASAVRASTTNTLDALSPAFAPFAARWDSEADRRQSLRTNENLKALLKAQRENTSARSTAATAKAQRTAARKATSNPLSAERRSARTADKAARTHRKSAKAALKAARKNYPQTLTRLAVKAHAAHLVPSGVTSYALSSADDWTLWPVGMSASLIGLNMTGLWLGRRNVALAVDDGMTAEERALCARLDPAHWVAKAEERGLAGTVTGVPSLTSGGIECAVRLDGTWTVKSLAGKADSIRALLGCRSELRMRITGGAKGGWGVIRLYTRSAADGISSAWSIERIPTDPALMSLGIDTETGKEVLVPFDERALFSGASGTGKSWALRGPMATAHLRGDLVFIDGKGEEANVWGSVCRCAVEPAEIVETIEELHAEMHRRRKDMKARSLSVWDGRQITAVVDEGQVVLAAMKMLGGKAAQELIQKLVELSSLGRSRGIVLWWATQYPVTDGAAPGVHQLIAPNLLTRISLRVAGSTQAQVALDDCAHYAPHQIPEGKEWRGHGYLKGYGARIIRMWTLTDADVKGLPVNVWKGPKNGGPNSGLTLVKSDDVPDVTSIDLTDNQRAVLTVVQNGASTNAEISKATNLNPGSVARCVEALEKRGLVEKVGTEIRQASA